MRKGDKENQIPLGSYNNIELLNKIIIVNALCKNHAHGISLDQLISADQRANFIIFIL